MKKIFICLLGASLSSTLHAMQPDIYDLTIATRLIIGKAIIQTKTIEHAIYPTYWKLKGWEEIKESPDGHFVTAEITEIARNLNTYNVTLQYFFKQDEKTVLFSDTLTYIVPSKSAMRKRKKVPGYQNVTVVIEVNEHPYPTK